MKSNYRQAFRHDAQRRAIASRLNRQGAFNELDRDETAAKLLFQGLQNHYIECLLAGKLDVWATAAHKIIDLLSTPATTVYKRSDLLIR